MGAMTGVELELRQLAAAHAGLPPDRVRSDSRLLQDLGLDGDEAMEFFVAVARRYNLELTDLWKDWNRHFAPEGYPLAGCLLVPVALFTAFATAMWLRDSLYLTRNAALLLGALLSAPLIWIGGRITKRRRFEPIRISDVVAAVERGRW